MTLEIWAILTIPVAILLHAWKVHHMSLNFSKLTAALNAVSASISAVATRIQDPNVDNNDQATIDSFADQLNGAASQLNQIGAAPADHVDTGDTGTGGVGQGDDSGATAGASSGAADTSGDQS